MSKEISEGFRKVHCRLTPCMACAPFLGVDLAVEGGSQGGGNAVLKHDCHAKRTGFA